MIDRREFLAQSGSCAAHLALAAIAMPLSARLAWARGPLGSVVAREPFGNLEKIADGVWALVSNPLGGDRTTLSNGGIIVGRNAVLAVEGFNQPAGARWMAGKAKELTGKWPTHVILTHYHADHANGVAGYLTSPERPKVQSTDRTRALIIERNLPADADRTAAMNGAEVLSATSLTTLDLGGRSVKIVPRGGHTDSDVSIELDDPSIVFCGDLFWNAMVPNFVDAVPTRLSSSVKALKGERATVYVPGHGAVGGAAEYGRYMAMLEEIEAAARKAHASGASAADAGAAFSLPASLGEWTLFSKAFYPRAFEAWYKELRGS